MMFVMSLKTTAPRMLVSAAVVVALLALVVGLSFCPKTASVAIVAEAEEQRVAFLLGLGYEVAVPGEVREVLVPAQSDETFAEYNRLQQTAGMDLTPLMGKRVKCWSYTVTNFPGTETVQAHILVYRGRIVGGDISSTRLEGLRQGLVAMSPVETERTETDGKTG